MYALKNLVVILFVLCSSEYSHGTFHMVQKSQIFDDGIFFINEESFNSGILVYAICDPSSENTTNCKIVQENYPYDEATYSCQLTIENNYLDGESSLRVSVMTLGEDKAVLYWKYRKAEDHAVAVKIGTVDFNTCEMNGIEVPDASSLTMIQLQYMNKFISYDDDSFDVFYSDPTRHPENGDLFKLHIDRSGKMTEQPKSANVEKGMYFNAFTVANRSPAKGYAFVKRNQFKSRKDFLRTPIFQVLLVKSDGTSKHLAEYKPDMLGAVAVGNNFISFCRKSDDKGHIVCTQYDEYGNVLFTTTLVTKNFNIDVIRSYNLPNGGMLVLHGALKYKLQKPINKKTGFEVIWIGSDGKEKGRIYDKKLQLPKGMTGVPYIYANREDGYCTTIVMTNEFTIERDYGTVPVNLNIVANCFTENDFLA